MKSISAREAKLKFGELIDSARAAPVTIEKHGRPVVVVLAIEEYERLARISTPIAIGTDAPIAAPDKTSAPHKAPKKKRNATKNGAPEAAKVATLSQPATPPPTTSSLIKSKQRVADHGEVFTPPWLVEAMLDLVEDEAYRIDARILEPACGSGNFLISALSRKLTTVRAKFGKSEFSRRHYGLLALMCLYGVEILPDNAADCRKGMLEAFTDQMELEPYDDAIPAATFILSQNIILGDAVSMRTDRGDPISFAEWGYLGRGKFQRRDFRLDALTGSSAFSAEGSLFAQLGKHEIFTPTRTYPTMTISDLARAAEIAV